MAPSTHKRSRSKRQRRNFIFLVAPAFLALTLVILIPFVMGIYYSFTNWGGIISPTATFNGLTNYLESFADSRFRYSLMVTFIFAFFNIIIINLVAFALAMIVSSQVKGRDIYRAGFFVPNLIGGIVLGYIWQFIYNNVFPQIGRLVAFDWLVENLFLGSPRLAVSALVLTSTWQYAGYIMMIYYAGLQNVPRSLYESASLDGANWWSKLRHITLPMIMPSFTVSLFLTINNSFKIFDVNYSLTGGGPSMMWNNEAIKSTEFITMNIYNTASVENHLAHGQARAVILFVILVVISLSQTYLTKRQEVEM
ncbi:carbohydrate ABC transporter permease [Facklamia miroungae]|uniref:Raffinose/stachyose/melibiose transport system permease protein n=1 Tax=Facklamia miroungae TaxID=120956 RepID=A0A1G7TB38_9LACT|nr:sugar ABC transporter permease [Facklamia miroungae]NKZ29720.1 sugar ABC transporter permease [Facklamia miroungae]SDG31800.1 raffinose/stachyose/melibiose transport system permease protein [Facklamia miroungae]